MKPWAELKPGEIVSVQLAASAYPAHVLNDGRFITHAGRIATGENVERVCSKIKTDSILPDASLFNEYQIDCAACLAKLRRLGVSLPTMNRCVLLPQPTAK